ncbi:hypothetical protein ABID82_002432 [Methylobacterium sp. PvP062]|uniref:Uncharacterized protein n=1 Tax=Methylobacterium radiotolerans TaxID=31998 RepID=A0ABV2NNE0_9HYPH|nr:MULTISPECIES: hypothetical protein [unclassified Methylobacterium]MBP2495237.1 hypothetical protein [Methylobacterium sp. PvP105]MBP2504892.1 hypothetical protein [Methylobacterium sp. PvP109]MCX7335898.1 hypothetical protein [Hyphomicrobiales bacterium]
MAESSTITREPEISARDVAAIPPDDYPAVQQALKRAAATDDQVAKNYALKRAAESIGLLSGHQPFPVEPFSDGAYPAVFLLIRESLEAGAPGIAAGLKDAMARSAALKVVARKLAPAAYGDKRRPYYTHACAGVEGMSATLHLRDGSLELVFKDEELDLINEEGRDLYVARIEASEVLALRQWLIDFLPASEAEISAGHGIAPLVSVTVPAPGTEERDFWLEAARQHGFEETSEEQLPYLALPAYASNEEGLLALMAAAREQGRKDVLDALAKSGPARPVALADGCRSAFAPCAHQKDDPTTLCGSCQRAAADRDFDEDMMPGGFN